MTIVVQKAGATGGGGPAMQPVGTIAARPLVLSGALQTFVETTLDNSIRSQADDNQVIKVRRRATNMTRTADASVTLPRALVEPFREWYRDACLGGSLPTRFKIPPDCAEEEVWRFAAPLQYDWTVDANANACRITMKLEQMPNWVGV